MIIKLLNKNPGFQKIYEEVYNLCLNSERMMNMFSKELEILDRNTVKLMIDEMEEELAGAKKRVQEAEEKAQKRVEEAEEQAQKRAEEAEEKAQKRAEEAEEKAQKRAEEAEEQAQKRVDEAEKRAREAEEKLRELERNLAGTVQGCNS